MPLPCWVLNAHCSLASDLHNFLLLVWSVLKRDRFKDPVLSYPVHLHAHLLSCSSILSSEKGSHREGWQEQTLYLFLK